MDCSYPELQTRRKNVSPASLGADQTIINTKEALLRNFGN